MESSETERFAVDSREASPSRSVEGWTFWLHRVQGGESFVLWSANIAFGLVRIKMAFYQETQSWNCTDEEKFVLRWVIVLFRFLFPVWTMANLT